MTTPDWENFAKAVLADWPTGDMEGSVLFDLALEYGMIQEVPGGYSSDHHIDADCICPEEGDPWYVYTFRGEAGPGLYSIVEMKKRIEELKAQLALSEGALDIASRSWGECQLVLEQTEAKLEKLIAGAETVLEEWDRGDEAAFRVAVEEMRADVAEAKGDKT
jgi:uncharacterized coiled-coil protein SlyX